MKLVGFMDSTTAMGFVACVRGARAGSRRPKELRVRSRKSRSKDAGPFRYRGLALAAVGLTLFGPALPAAGQLPMAKSGAVVFNDEEQDVPEEGRRPEHRSRIQSGVNGSRGSLADAKRYHLSAVLFPPLLLLLGWLLWSLRLRQRVGQRVRHLKNEVAEREQAVSRLRHAKETADAANRSKSDFLATMSHEVRTLLTAVQGFAETLHDEIACCTRCTAGEDCAHRLQGKEAVEAIQRNSALLLNMMNDILDLSKIEAGKLEVEYVCCSLFTLIADVERSIRVRANAKGLSFDIEAMGPLPETIATDPTRLRQILINLLSNAIKFTETGEVRLVLRLGDKEPNHPRLRFEVIDTGMGMTEEQAVRVFAPFVQGDPSTARKYGGTGLGLSISKRLAQRLGGELSVVDTNPGRGTRFLATIATGSLEGVRMIEDPALATIATATGPEQPIGGQPTAELNCRILLAEDSPDNRQLISLFLERAGAEVTLAEDGRVAVEKALEDMPLEQAGNPTHWYYDVILMDMQMPVLDGYQATRLLRRRGYRGSIIAITAHAMSSDREKCLEAGCSDYISKPIDRGELLKIISSRLEHTLVANR